MQREKVIISKQIIKEYRKLLKYCRDSIHAIDIFQVRQAFTMANEACIKHFKKFHEPLVIQSLQVAQIVTNEIGLDTSSIICALLYKFVENGSLEIETVKTNFDNSIAQITDELAKIAAINTRNIRSQAENFRKLFLTLTSDVRVILIKLAERLFIMRNLDIEDFDTQQHIAHEVFDLYAPLGHRLGLYSLKTELEDLAMKYTNRDMYDYIIQQLQDTAIRRNRFIREIITPIKMELDSHGFDYDIKSRTKSVFSIWNKMRKKNIELEEVYDLFAIRIILNSDIKNEKSDCWRAFSIVTGLYQPNPERMRDWISVPKSNGYESLHTTVVVPGGKWVEVQIRSNRMDEIAEKGLAAHWKYKGQKSSNSFDNWLNKMREVLESPELTNYNILDAVKLNLNLQEIFVFTPKGDLKRLPKSSTVLDFAFDIHSDIGSKCVGARVNGKNVPIRHILRNGDRVEILTSKNQKPKIDWIDFVKTSKAKSKIKLIIKEKKLQEAENGKEILRRRFRNWKISFNDLLISKLLKHYKLKNSIDFYSMIANEKINISDIKSLVKSFEKNVSPIIEKIGDVPVEKLIPVLSEKIEEVLEIDEKILNNVEYKLAQCCNPIYGDDVFAFVTINEGIKIHRSYCPNAAQMKRRFGYRILKARWAGRDSQFNFQTAIKLYGNNEIGILSKISDIINKDPSIKLRSININTGEEHFEGTIKLFVVNVSHLDRLIHKLLKIKGINNVQRLDMA